MSVLTPEMVQEGLRSLPQWKLEGKEIVRHYQFPDFAAAMAFVNQVAEAAETAGTIRISISVTTRCGWHLSPTTRGA